MFTLAILNRAVSRAVEVFPERGIFFILVLPERLSDFFSRKKMQEHCAAGVQDNSHRSVCAAARTGNPPRSSSIDNQA
jgi:hypothetical protein